MQTYLVKELNQWKALNEKFLSRVVSGEWEKDDEVIGLFEEIVSAPAHQRSMMKSLFVSSMEKDLGDELPKSVLSTFKKETWSAMFLQKVVAKVWGKTGYPNKDVRTVVLFYYHIYTMQRQLEIFDNFIDVVKGNQAWGPHLARALLNLGSWAEEEELFRGGKAECFRAMLRKHDVTALYGVSDWGVRVREALDLSTLDETTKERMLTYSLGRYLESQQDAPIVLTVTKKEPLEEVWEGGEAFLGYKTSVRKNSEGTGYTVRVEAPTGFYGSMGEESSQTEKPFAIHEGMHEMSEETDGIRLEGLKRWDDLMQEFIDLPPFLIQEDK